MNNRKHNSKNPHQGDRKRVLCVCSAGLLRSPTAALVLANDFGHNTRACGVDADYALIAVDEVLVDWADEIVCMGEGHAKEILAMYPAVQGKKVIVLDIPDKYAYRDPELCELIRERYAERTEDGQHKV